MFEKSISTLLVEDHEITRLGIRKMLEQLPEVRIVAETADGKTAVQKAIELNPVLVLMDIGLPYLDGIEATRAIKETLPAKIIMITSHANDEDVFAGLSAGADAYCLKDISAGQLGTAIRSVMDGALWIDPGIAKQVIKAATRTAHGCTSTTFQKHSFGLSERELEVLSLLVDGSSNQQIADRLILSTETVKTHMRHVMEKLRVSDRTQAAVKAVREGIVFPGISMVTAGEN